MAQAIATSLGRQLTEEALRDIAKRWKEIGAAEFKHEMEVRIFRLSNITGSPVSIQGNLVELGMQGAPMSAVLMALLGALEPAESVELNNIRVERLPDRGFRY